MNISIKTTVLALMLLFTCSFSSSAQQRVQTVRGRVVDLYTKKPMENAHIINMATLHGATTDENGFFSISAVQNDSLYISFVGYKSLNVVVSLNMFKREYTSFYVTQDNSELAEVDIRAHHLSGILEVDIKTLDPAFENKVITMYNVKKSNQIDERATKPTPLNPVEFISGFFSADKKLKKMKDENEVSKMLADRYDRDFLKKMLNLSQEEIDQLLIYCRQDPKWALKASDLDLINALLKCKEDLDAKAAAKARGEEFDY
ncbi:MAG: carboxypeptidase-like regulatory domain-containing protein [Flavobacteriales bacterium]|nr:carboxypeptidase-like regulatory domain-containing protein [Flavobacteriales bacterium]